MIFGINILRGILKPKTNYSLPFAKISMKKYAEFNALLMHLFSNDERHLLKLKFAQHLKVIGYITMRYINNSL